MAITDDLRIDDLIHEFRAILHIDRRDDAASAIDILLVTLSRLFCTGAITINAAFQEH